MKLRLVLTLFILFLSGLVGLPVSALVNGGVKGRVVNVDDNKPVGEVTVNILGGSVVTDAQGNFNFANLPPGDYLLHTVSARHFNRVVAARVKPGEDSDLTIRIKTRVTKIEGLVVDEDGRPVIGVEIYTSPEIDETKTDEKGYFKFDKKRILDEARKPIGEEPIAPGVYKVYAQKLQYTKAEKKITVIPGLRNNLGIINITKIGTAVPDDTKRGLDSPATIDEPTQGAGEVKLD